MAVKATFLADFASFKAGVDSAEVKLRSFEDSTFKVGKSLTAMTDKFSGRKVIEEATMMNKLLGDTGSLALLTGKELQAAGVKAQEAVEKMRKLGIEVPPGLQRIADQTKNVSSGMSGMLGTASKLAGAFGIAFSVGAVVNFGRSILASADSLVKMSDRTGIGTQGLQRLQVAGDDAGNSIEDMTGAINQMQNRMASNDPSFLNALRALKINAEEFRDLKPDEQFIKMSEALRGITDPAQQVAIAMDVFGRQGATVLPTLKRGFDDVKDAAVGMSDETVRRLDDMGDAFDRYARRAKGLAAEVALALFDATVLGRASKLTADLEKQVEGLRKVAETAKALAQPQGLDTKLNFNVAAELAKQETALARLGTAGRKAGDESARAFAAMMEHIADIERGTPKATFRLLEFDQALATIGKRTIPLTGVAVNQLTDGLDRMGKVIPVAFNFVTPQRNLHLVADAVSQLRPEFQMLTEDFRQFREELPQLQAEAYAQKLIKIAGAFGAAGAVLDQVQGKFAEFGRIVANTGEQIFSNLASGNVFGAVIAGITGVGTILNKVFGDAEQRKVNDMRDEFVAASGGIHALNLRAKEAGLTLDRLLKTENVKAYTAEMERLQQAFDFQNTALDKLADAEEKYHLSLDKTSAGLFESYKLLTAKGHDASTVVMRMKDDWIALVAEARKFGIALPESLRPILQRLVDMGELTDDNGEKLTDLSSITFGPVGESGKSAFDKMTLAVDKLVAAIKVSLGLALDDVERRLLGLPALVTGVAGTIGGAGGGLTRNPGGGDIPRTTEAFLTSRQAGTLSTSGSAVTVNITVQAIDSQSVDEWLRNGAAEKIAQQITPKLPGVKSSYGLGRAA